MGVAAYKNIEFRLRNSAPVAVALRQIHCTPQCVSTVERFLLDREFRRNFLSKQKKPHNPSPYLFLGSIVWHFIFFCVPSALMTSPRKETLTSPNACILLLHPYWLAQTVPWLFQDLYASKWSNDFQSQGSLSHLLQALYYPR